MKHKTSELTGALLDHAVAIAEGARLPDYWRDPHDGSTWSRPGREEWNPGERWGQGGPIIERERIGLWAGEGPYHGTPPAHEWFAEAGPLCRSKGFGPTPLIAAMRAYVASKLGDEVDL